MDVLILSKTHMNGKCCIGGITTTGRYVRLLNSLGENQPENTDFKPRQVYTIEFIDRKNLDPPHVEDVLITSKKLKGKLKDEIKIIDYIKRYNAPIWEGSPDILFDKMLQWTDNGSGYVTKEYIPKNSVGFWLPNKDLVKSVYYDRVRYSYKSHQGWRSIPYVGFDDPIQTIPAETLVRVSLARWWDTKGTTELRCQLQLSGWYDLDQ